MKGFARVGAIVAILFVAGGFLLTHGSVTPSRSVPKGALTLTSTDGAVLPPHRQPASDNGAVVDLYGNEVNDAIATYTLDPAGSLYELHSPQTEVPRLGSPKS